MGRGDHRVKISGYRVEIGEVEVALRQIPGVAIAVAALVTTAGGADVLAATLRVDDPRLTVELIREAMAERVPAHMIPQHLSLVEHIPFTLAGKIDRRVVAGQLAAAVNDAAAPDRRPAVRRHDPGEVSPLLVQFVRVPHAGSSLASRRNQNVTN